MVTITRCTLKLFSNEVEDFGLGCYACSTSLLQAQISENVRFGFKLSPHVSWMATDVKPISSGATLAGITVGTSWRMVLERKLRLDNGRRNHLQSRWDPQSYTRWRTFAARSRIE